MKVIGKRSLAFTVDKLNMWTASTEVEEFKELVSKMFGKVIIDCSKVKYIDASGLGALLQFFGKESNLRFPCNTLTEPRRVQEIMTKER